MKTAYNFTSIFTCIVITFIMMQPQNLLAQNQKNISKENNSLPSIMVQNNEGKQYPLRISALHIQSDIIGNIAVTTMDMTFFNETDRVLEGELIFPVAEGNTVSRFAMELDGTMREGVVVEKAKGRQVFESIVRRRIDPALLEMSKGNIFRARVYPILPQKNKRIILAYEQELQRNNEGQLFILPLNYQQPIDSFSLEVQLRNRSLAPDLRYNAFDNILFQKKDKNFFAEFSAQRFTADRPLTLLLPAGIDDSMHVFIGKREKDNTIYFYVTGVPDSKIIEKTLPKTITLLWDNSGSAQKNNKKLILDALEKYLQRCGTYSVRLIEFAIETRNVGTFTNYTMLRKAIDELVPDGATSFQSCDFSSYTSDEIILISDGIQTFGAAPAIRSTVPITVIHAAQSAEHGYLRNIALSSGGQYINAVGLSADDIVKTLTTVPLHFLGAECSVGSNIFPSIPQPIKGNFSLAGITKDSIFSLTLRFGIGKTTLSQQTLSVKSPYSHPLIPRLWAQKKLSELETEHEKNSKDITALGKDFSLVTRYTSLIVLEQISDYVKYRIIPPTEEMRKEYYRLVTIQDSISLNNQQKNTPITCAISNMARKKDWYNIDFFKKIEEEKRQEEARKKVHEILIKAEKSAVSQHNNDDENMQLYYQKKKDSLQILIIPNSQEQVGYGKLRGTVTTIDGELLGAIVKVLSTKRGSLTKADGSFRINKLPLGDYILEISHIGYYTNYEKITILKDQTTDISIILKEEKVNKIDEVVIKSERFKESVTHDNKGSIRERGVGAGVSQTQNSQSTRVYGALRSTDDFNTESRPDAATYISSPPNNVSMSNVVIQESDADALNPGRSIRTSSGSLRVEETTNEETTTLNGASVESSLTPTAQPPKIALAEPTPTMAYMEQLQSASDKELMNVYRELRRNFGHLPMFYTDAADIFYKRGQKRQALRILSNLAELQIESQRLLRILGRRLLQYGFASEAVAIFREVYSIREEEPQSMRDLGLALAEAGKYQEAVDTLYAMAQREWDSRFPEIETIALTEMNTLIAKAGTSVNTHHIHPELLMSQPLGLRIVLDWDADNCDIDLWVIDPQKEKCYYSNPNTKIGGRLSRDLTGGYGPEEFSLKTPLSGTYTIKAHYYGDRQQSIAGPTTVTAYIWTNYGTPQEKKQEITLRLKGTKEIVDIGTVTIP